MEKFTISTRAKMGAPEVKTVVTLNWTGASDETIKALARQTVIVKWQGGARKNGIPAAATINVKDYAPGTRHAAPVDVFALIGTLSAEEKARLLASLQA